MALSTQPYKGTRDFYPSDFRIRSYCFSKMRDCARRFGFEEYDGPMLEPFELYAAKTGEEIVNQQLYWLMDRGERKLAIRPEMTPTLARMVAAKINELPKPLRWFSIPNLWRYERPQRGRLREHWQLNVDILGGDLFLADAEILNFAFSLMKSFGGEKHSVIRLNNRRLMDHFFKNELGLDAPLVLTLFKALDAREKIGEDKFNAWLSELGLNLSQSQKLESFMKSTFKEIAKKYPCEGVTELLKLFKLLKESELPEDQVVFDPRILRGLDYYTGTVFEMYDVSPENHRAMFGGGRYDNLVGLFGKQELSGVGFGMGDVTLQNFLQSHGLLPELQGGPDVFITLPKNEVRTLSEQIARDLRALGLSVVTPLEVSGFGVQLKMASKQGARFVILLGEDEIQQGQVGVKNLVTGQQETVFISKLSLFFNNKQ